MNCPACKTPMIVLELEEIEIDHCITCGGIWLDAGELELLLDDLNEKNNLISSFQIDNNTKEKSRICPICLKAMAKVRYGADKMVLIDKCRSNDGLWFDKNELQEAIKISGLDKNNKILTLLKDMFKK